MADSATAFHAGFAIETAGCVADVAFAVRGDGDSQRPLCRFVAEGAVQLFAVGEFISDVIFVLLGVEQRVVGLAFGKVALRRAGAQALRLVVTDRTGLQRTRCELNDVAFHAGFVAGKFQTQLFVAICRGDYPGGDLSCAESFVARIAFQFAREIGVRHFDQTLMCLVSEVAVILDVVRGRLARGRFCRRLIVGLLAARGERVQWDREQGQAAERERNLHSLQSDCRRPDCFEHFR